MKGRTLFNYLYTALERQILNGVLCGGTKLPSLRRLSIVYGVGIRTARDVMKELKKNGYVDSVPRVGYIGILKNADGQKDASRVALSKRNVVFDVIKVMSYFLPSVIEFAARRCSKDDIRKWKAVIKKDDVRVNPSVTDMPRFILLEMIAVHKNPVMSDILVETDRFVRMSPVYQSDIDVEIADIMSDYMLKAVKLAEAREYRQIRQAVEEMLRGVASALEQNYVDTLPVNAGIGDLDSLRFDWRLHKKQHRYIEIVNNMLKRIGHNEFAGQSKLPPVSGLAKEYGVSVHTAGLACIRLSELGIISATRYGRFVFTPGRNNAAGIRGANPLIKCEIKRFIWVLRFYCLAAEGFAAILFETLYSEKRKTARYNILTLYDYVQLFVDSSEKAGRGGFALTIGNELLDVMAWEFYFIVNWPQRYEAIGCHIEKSSKALAKYNKKTFFSEIARANKAMLDMTEELAGDIISI